MRRYKDDYMNFVMSPPAFEDEHNLNKDMVSYRAGDVRIVNRNTRQEALGLGQLPTAGVFGETSSWMPIVIIVVSAMALITLYAVVTAKR